MSFKSFAVSFRGAPHAAPVVSPPAHSHRSAWPARVAGCVAGVHALIAAPAARPAATREAGVPHARRMRAVAARHFARAAVLAARAALRAVWTGRPLTPCGYAILALSVTGVVLAVLIATSPAGDELESALPLCWWFV